jgi:hypothetical protein
MPERARRSQRQRRFHRRRATAFLLLACLAAGIGGLLSVEKDDKSSSVDRVTNARQQAKRAARIERLKQRLAKTREAERREKAAASPQGNGPSSGSPSFSFFSKSLPGEVGLAYAHIGRGSQVVSLGPLQSGTAWSTIKVALAARVISDANGPGNLSPRQHSLISSALRASDNEAAMQLWTELIRRHGGSAAAARAVGEVLASAGDRSTEVSSVGRDGFSPYGQTDWSLAGQVRFMAAVGARCVRGSPYLLDEMGQVIPSQRWGLGEAGSAVFKGGWGPGTDGRYLVRQVGILNHQGQPFAIAIATIPDDGSFSSGQALLSQLAEWAAENIRPGPPSGC